MSAFAFTVETDGDDPIRLCKMAVTGLDDWRPMWGAVAKAWRSDMRARFRTQGRSAGVSWPSYASTDEDAYYRYYKGGVLGVPQSVVATLLLRWRGRERLYPSLVDESHPEHVDKRERTSWTGGTRVPYARHHDRGMGVAPERMGGHDIPRRRLVNVGRRFQRELTSITAAYARSVLVAAEDAAKRGDVDAAAIVSDIRAGLLTTEQAQDLGAR